MPITSQEDFQKAKSILGSGKAKDPARLQAAITQYQDDQARGYFREPEHKPGDILATGSKGDSAAKAQGLDIDFSRDNGDIIRQAVADDPSGRAERTIRAQARDASLPNASKLKVFSDPPEYSPPASSNPFSAFKGVVTKQYWYEPSVSEFKEALKEGPLADRLRKEFPQLSDPSKLIDKDLEGSETFRAFQDASWRHAFADAVKSGTPIVRVEYSPNIGTMEKLQAQALDKGVAAATGAAQSMSMGLYDPALRFLAPETAEAERRSRVRNPKTDIAGEVAGAISPTGLPSQVAKLGSKALGALGLGSKGLGGLVRSAGAGALTGAVDTNVRAAAQSAAEALDAHDAAVDALKRVYSSLSPERSIPRTVEGMGAGGVLGALGHGLGSLAGAGARAIVGSGRFQPTLSHAAESGVKMSAIGEPVLTPEAQGYVNKGMAARKAPDVLAAQDAMDPMLETRLGEQQGLLNKHLAETADMQSKLTAQGFPKEGTVSTGPIAAKIIDYAKSLPAGTPESAAAQKSLERWARKIRSEGEITPRRFDEYMQELDKQANWQGKENPYWSDAARMFKEYRDEFQINEPTAAFALEDPVGNRKVVNGYSGMKTSQSRAIRQQEFDNRVMGLPSKLKAEPTELPRQGATEQEAGDFLANHPQADRLKKFINEDRAVASRLERGDTPQELRPGRVSGSIENASGANQALRDAAEQGYVHQGTVFRGTGMAPEDVQKMIASGRVTSDSIWSTSTDQSYASDFASKAGRRGRVPVVFEIDSRSAVPISGLPDTNTFSEALVPTGEKFKITDSYRAQDGSLVVKLTTNYPSAEDLAVAAKPKVRLGRSGVEEADNRKAFQNSLIGTANPENAVANDKLLALADRAGVLDKVKVIQQLRDSNQWKNVLGSAISGMSTGGGTYLKTNNVLRGVPLLKSIAGGLTNPGGLPKMEASPEAVDVVDKFLRSAVPEWEALNLRGGQSAKATGAALGRGKERPKRDELTPEQAQFAANVLKNLLSLESAP